MIKKDSIDAGPLSSTSTRVPTRWASLKRKEPHDGFDEDDDVRRAIVTSLLIPQSYNLTILSKILDILMSVSNFLLNIFYRCIDI